MLGPGWAWLPKAPQTSLPSGSLGDSRHIKQESPVFSNSSSFPRQLYVALTQRDDSPILTFPVR